VQLLAEEENETVNLRSSAQVEPRNGSKRRAKSWGDRGQRKDKDKRRKGEKENSRRR
jgi:hypothetical protein